MQWFWLRSVTVTVRARIGFPKYLFLQSERNPNTPVASMFGAGADGATAASPLPFRHGPDVSRSGGVPAGDPDTREAGGICMRINHLLATAMITGALAFPAAAMAQGAGGGGGGSAAGGGG